MDDSSSKRVITWKPRRSDPRPTVCFVCGACEGDACDVGEHAVDELRRQDQAAQEERIAALVAAKLAGVRPPPQGPAKNEPRLGSAKEAADLLGINVEALWKRVQRAQIPRRAVVRTGKRGYSFRLDLLVAP